MRVSRVIAVLAKSACKHAIFLATRVNKECALTHSRACGGRLRYLPYTPQCASSRSVFCFTGKQFPVKQKKFLLFLLIAHRNKRNFFYSHFLWSRRNNYFFMLRLHQCHISTAMHLPNTFRYCKPVSGIYPDAAD